MRRPTAGFTLVEMMVVVVIIGILATIFITQFSGETDKARKNVTIVNIKQIEGALERFKNDNGRYPDKLENLVHKPVDAKNWVRGYLKEVPTDGWGNPFIYNPKGNDGDPEIISNGADGQTGGNEFNADITNHDNQKK